MLSRDKLVKLYPFLHQLVALARETIQPRRIIVFGSRARGTARDDSDFDVAFDGADRAEWGRFSAEVEERVRTLHRFDLVDLARADAHIVESVAKEGVCIDANDATG